jgi:hypothetical protein
MPPFRQCCSNARLQAVLRWLRIGAALLLGIAAALLFLYLIHHGLLPVLAVIFPSLHRTFLDWAVYGAYPTQTFVSTDLIAPKPWRTLWDKSCDGGNILVGPNGPSVEQPSPMMLNTDGDLIWMSHEYGHIMNFNVQTYKGKDYLTFWAGNKQGGVGQGDMFMLDSNYKVAYRIKAVGEGNKGDIHEFRLTEDGTALIAVFNNTQYDLRDFGWFRPSDGWLTDGMFQEIDIETNELLFQWRAIDHFKPKDTFYFDPFGGYQESHPFDYYHLNSIEKDSKGNYLVSSRHYHHIIYIQGKTGKVLWELGGHSKDFKDLSHGKATEHKWQHNARWVDEEKGILSFFDNGVAGPLHVDAPYSKGTIVQLDLENMTAKHLHTYKSPGKLRAASQGNVQIINEDQVMVGWGATAAYTEFNMEGEPLCEVHFAASWLFWFERWKSYRVYRHFGWVGRPDYPPVAAIRKNKLYVSWNGATEVAFWELQGLKNGGWKPIETIRKQKFEDCFELPTDETFDEYRVVALDGDEKVLKFSDSAEVKSTLLRNFGIVCGVFAFIGVLGGMFYWRRLRIRRRREGRAGSTVSLRGLLWPSGEPKYSALEDRDGDD